MTNESDNGEYSIAKTSGTDTVKVEAPSKEEAIEMFKTAGGDMI